MASYRHLARTCVMQTLFEIDMADEVCHLFDLSSEDESNNKAIESSLMRNPQDILARVLKEFAPKLTEKEFATSTLKGVIKNKKDIIDIIEKYAPEWPIDKIARIDRAILEIGVYEIVFAKDIPPVVAINEAVEIAKHFGDNNSQKFINGVLSTVMKNYDQKL